MGKRFKQVFQNRYMDGIYAHKKIAMGNASQNHNNTTAHLIRVAEIENKS